MVTITTEYQGELRTISKHEPSGSTLITDAPVDNHGKGEAFSPTDLLGTALATCVATLMGIQAEALKVDIKGMKLVVTKHMSEDMPRRIAKLPVEIWVPGTLSSHHRELLEKAAHKCPVHQSLNSEIEKPMTFHWQKEE